MINTPMYPIEAAQDAVYQGLGLASISDGRASACVSMYSRMS